MDQLFWLGFTTLVREYKALKKKGASKRNILERSKSYWPVLAIFAAVTAIVIGSGAPATAEAQADVLFTNHRPVSVAVNGLTTCAIMVLRSELRA